MRRTLDELARQYASALQDYLAGAGEAALHRVYGVGHDGIKDGLGLLQMAALHHEALAAVLSPALTAEERARVLAGAGEVFAESLAPFEMVHRGFREANAALRRVNEALEEEARRIAQALHDEAAQLLASVHLALDEVAGELPPPARTGLKRVKGFLDEVEVQLRRLSHELRPPVLDDLGLTPALEFLSRGISARAGLAIAVEGPTEGRLPRLIETTLYRIVQEALTNVTRHARATRVRVQVRRESRVVRCVVEDDGVGFDAAEVFARPAACGLGLVGMRERLDAVGGTLRITSTPGGGARLAAEIPLEG